MSINKHQKAESCSATSAPLFAGLMFALVLSGCSNTSATRIEARDSPVALPELRMAYNFDHEKQAAAPHAGHAVEIGATTVTGSGSQSLAAGQLPVILNFKTFTAPQQLKIDFDFSYSDISWRYRIFRDDGKFGGEVSLGGGYTSIDLKVSSTTQVAANRYDSVGMRIGVSLIYRLSSNSSIHASSLSFVSPYPIYGAYSMGRNELVYANAFHDNFRLRAGYARWHAFGYSSGSDFEMDFAGPLLALDWEF